MQLRRRAKKQETLHPNPIKVLLEYTEEDEKYVNMMLKKSARRKLEQCRRNPLPKERPSLIDPEIENLLIGIETKLGLHKAPIEPIMNCRKCYFSSSFRLIGTNWYCLCTNIGRTPHQSSGKWVHCENNLPCWRAPR